MQSDHLGPRPVLVLPFDSRYLASVGGSQFFGEPAEVMDWIDSVSSFLQEWHDNCLVFPENEQHMKTALVNVYAFVKEVMEETDQQHYNARVNSKLVFCPSREFLLAKTSGLLDFKGYTAATACLVARYGVRGGDFKLCEDECGWHLAAVMLLVSVIADLESGNHFATFFKRNAQAKVDSVAAEVATTCANGDPDVATLEQNFHGLSMEAGDLSNTGDAQVQALQHGISSMNISQ
jgi:hypothetical protein